MRLRSLIAVVAAGSLVALAGCTDPAPPTSSTSSATSPSPSTSASPSTSPSATATTGIEGINIPADALEHTYAGAQAMAKFFIEQLDRGFVTNDGRVLQAISDPECVACSDALGKYKSQKAKGQHQFEASMTVNDFAEFPPQPMTQQQTVDTLVTVNSTKIVDSSGATVLEVPASKHTFRVKLTWVGTFWRIDAAGEAPA